jgi:hypothetical protein
MLHAREAVGRRSWSHPQEPRSEEWWGDVLADPRARRREQRASDLPLRRAFYTLADEKRETILVACSKCDWKAAFQRDELITSHGRDCPMPNLLNHLAAPSCPRLGSNWDRGGCAMSSQSDGTNQARPCTHQSRLFTNRWLPQTTCALGRCSGGLLPPSPPAEKATACQDQAGQSSTRDGARDRGWAEQAKIIGGQERLASRGEVLIVRK